MSVVAGTKTNTLLLMKREDRLEFTKSNPSPSLASSYHEQNQSFLEHAQAKRERLTPEQIVERERQKLTMSPAQKHTREEASSSQKLNHVTPAFVFLLNQMQPLVPPDVVVRKHHLKPIAMGDDEEWNSEVEVISRSSSGMFSGKDAISLSSGGWMDNSSSGACNLDSHSAKDHRDDEKYISSESSDGIGQKIEKLTRELCERNSPEGERDQQVSSPETETKRKVKKPKKTTRKEHDDDIENLKPRTRKTKKRDDNVELKRKKDNRRKSKERKKKRISKDDEFLKRYLKEFEYDRAMLMEEWKHEYDLLNKEDEDWESPGGLCESFCRKCVDPCVQSVMRFLSFAEVFFGNMPITVAAVGLSWVTQGTIWFKFMEENTDACTTVRYNSDGCTFGEFPGCFECDTSNPIYLLTLTFHYCCHSVAFTCCALFLLKILVAGRVVVDELRNPATSSPMGIVCITLECILAGIFGKTGESIVIGVSIFHVLLSFWFCYMAIFKFRLLPDPSWYPNCVGLAYAAVKSWLYFPWLGKGFMALCMFYFYTMFFIGTIRVATNLKIAAPVCFIGLSAPSITMYAMTIMAQPSHHREGMIEAEPTLMHHFELVHRNLYVPAMHVMMIFSLVGMASALHSLYQRWPTFKHKPFSPAHFAFVFPILSHTNAVQAYRSGVDSFAGIPIGNSFKLILFNYWFICLVSGTILNFIFTVKYVRRLPHWTKIDVSEDDEQPPSPSHTVVHECMYESDAHETILSQNFVSPAVLQANETGQLVRLRRGTEEYDKFGPYVRTRNVVAFGWDLPMTDAELRQERAELLHWVAVNAPRTRNRTLSHNGAFQSLMPSLMEKGGHEPYGSLATNNDGGTTNEQLSGARHSRSYTHHF